MSTKFSRVEKWRGGLGWAYRWPALSFAGASLASPCFRFHFPLIEPDVRISRIRLSDKASCVRPRKAGGPLRKPDQTKLLVQSVVGIPRGSRARHFVFGAQPLAQPPARVSFHRPVRGSISRISKSVFHASCLFSNGYSASNPPYSGPAWDGSTDRRLICECGSHLWPTGGPLIGTSGCSLSGHRRTSPQCKE